MINYLLATQEEKELAENAKKILESILTRERIRELDREGRFPVEALKKLAEAGYYGMDIPEAWGGLGLGKRTMAVIYEEMGKIDAGFTLSFSVACGRWKQFVEINWPEDEKKAFIEKIIAGEEIGAFCLSEPGAGSDAGACMTTAVQDGDDWILNGTKCFVTNGPVATYFHVFAWTDKTVSAGKGMTLFHIPAGTPGLSIGNHEDKMGLRLSETSDVILQDVRVPSKNIIGKLGGGFAIGMEELEVARVFNMLPVLGLAQRALDEAVEYAKVRKAFGQRIIDHEGLAFLIADMQAKVNASRALLYYGIDVYNEGKTLGTLSPTGKTFISEAAYEVASDAIQVLGGYGYSREYPVEKLARDAKVFAIFEGTNQIQRRNCTRMLAGKPEKK